MLRDEIKAILNEFSPEEAYRHTKTVGETWVNRISGTKALDGSVDYVVQQLRRFGIENATAEPLEGLISLPMKSEVRVVSPDSRILDSRPFAQIGSTPDEGTEADLVYVGPGGFSDYEGKDVRGKIVLAELSYAPPRPEKARIATLKGAAGLLLSNWGPSESEIIPLGTVKSVWGNPTPDNIAAMDVVPAAGISRKDGEYLVRLCEEGPVKVRLIAQATREWKTLRQPWARIEGTWDPEKFVILGGHHDSWAQGITDNASGDAVKLEIARVLAKHRDLLRRSVEFTFWVGHENGIMEGSTWYVDTNWERLNRGAILYINVDSPGMSGTSRYVAWSSPETIRWHSELDREVVRKVRVDRIPLSKIGDQSFFGVGVPSIFGLTMHTPEEIESWRGAILGTWYHSEQDTMGNFDLDLEMESLRANAAYVLDLCTRLVIPFEYATVADEFIAQLQEYQAAAADRLDLAHPIALARLLKAKAAGLDSYGRSLESRYEVAGASEREELEERADLVNECTMKLGRVLTRARAQVTDRYGQDSYGLSALHKSVPVLYETAELGKLDPSDQRSRLLVTKLVRERNRVSDALYDAAWQIDNTMSLLGA